MIKKPKIRLQDIADRANLSVSAVSLALRDHPSISVESKKRIHQIRQELGYQMERFSPGRQTSVNPDFVLNVAYCVIGESMQDVSYLPLAKGVSRACDKWQAHLVTTEIHPESTPLPAVTMATGDTPSGYLLVGWVTDEIIDHFSKDNRPIVVMGSNQLTRKISSVRPDSFGAGQIMTERALKEGHRNFIFVVANLTSLHNEQVLQGIRMTLMEHGLSLDKDHVIIASSFALHDSKYLDQISSIANGPTAILTAGVVTADACASVLYAKGWIKEKKLTIYSLRPSKSGEINPFYNSLNLGSDVLGQVAVDRLVQDILGYKTYADPWISLISPLGWLDEEQAKPVNRVAAVAHK